MHMATKLYNLPKFVNSHARNRHPNKVVVNTQPKQQPSFRDIFLKTELHGFPDWYQAHSLRLKIVWSIILLVAFVCMINGLYQVSQDFIERPILTTYSITHEPGGMPFPDIYICPAYPLFNMQTDDYYRAVVKAGGIGKNTEILSEKTTVLEGLYSRVLIPKVIPKYDLQAVVMSTGYRLPKFFKECSFAGQGVNCSDIAERIFDAEYGVCFLVRVNKRQQIAGFGLSLVLDLQLTHTMRSSKKAFPLFDGVTVQVQMPFTPGSARKTFISPGKYTNLELQARRLHCIQRTRSQGGGQECTPLGGGQNRLKVLTANYTLDLCHFDCIQNLVLENCNCYLAVDKRYIKSHILSNANWTFCNTTETTDCVFPTVWEQKTLELQSCTKHCKIPCDNWEFDTHLSFMKFPSALWDQQQFKYRDDEDERLLNEKRQAWKRDYILVNIAYGSLQFVDLRQEQSMTFDTFVSNIGGQVGLWLGASIVTLIKFVMVACSVCRHKLRKIKSKTMKIKRNVNHNQNVVEDAVV